MRGRRNNLVVNRRRFIQGAGAAGGAIAVGLVLPRQSWGQDAPPQVVVGQVVPFTGSAAEYGQYYRDAAALALQHINTAAEQAFGRPIVANHVVEVSHTLPTPPIEASRHMVEADGAHAIIAARSSGVPVPITNTLTHP